MQNNIHEFIEFKGKKYLVFIKGNIEKGSMVILFNNPNSLSIFEYFNNELEKQFLIVFLYVLDKNTIRKCIFNKEIINIASILAKKHEKTSVFVAQYNNGKTKITKLSEALCSNY